MAKEHLLFPLCDRMKINNAALQLILPRGPDGKRPTIKQIRAVRAGTEPMPKGWLQSFRARLAGSISDSIRTANAMNAAGETELSIPKIQFDQGLEFIGILHLFLAIRGDHPAWLDHDPWD